MLPYRALIGVCVAGITALPATAQQPQPLGRPAAEFAEPFSQVTAVRELEDGRLIIADSREKTLQIIDMRTGQVRPIGREGRGPGEWLSIVSLLPQPGFQTLVGDGGNRRFLQLGPGGEILGTLSLPSPPSSAAPGAPQMPAGFALLGMLVPQGVDRWGRLYFQPVSISRPGTPLPDSAAILRWTVGRPQADTVGWIRSGNSGMVWGAAPQWHAAPDGRIVRANPDPYRLALIDSTGRVTEGPVVPYVPVRVTEADREEVRNRQSSQMAQVGQAMRAQMPGAAATPAPRPPEIRFAETKPPFYGPQSISATPDGQIWILRTNAFGDSIPVYDVFNDAGQWQRRVTLGARSRLVGFGRNSVYVVRIDEDDLEYLQRYGLGNRE